jgi:hypothetical protein
LIVRFGGTTFHRRSPGAGTWIAARAAGQKKTTGDEAIKRLVDEELLAVKGLGRPRAAVLRGPLQAAGWTRGQVAIVDYLSI